MSLSDVSIKRPVFITSVVILMLALGLLCFSRLGVDLFPNVTFPVVTVNVPYPGAGPEEVETLVIKPLEDEFSTIAGVKRLSARSQEGFGRVVAEFSMETDVKYAEQQIRDRVSSARAKLPSDIKEPTIRRIDPGDQPVLTMSLTADLPEAKLRDLAEQVILPKLEQVNQVGLVEVKGGRKREVRVSLDRKKLKDREISVSTVASRLGAAGENVPAGKVSGSKEEVVFRSMGQFQSLDDVRNTIVNFFGNDVPTTIREIGSVEDTLQDETNRAYVNGKKSLFITLYRQSGSNTVAVVNAAKARVTQLNEELAKAPGNPKIQVMRDAAVWIRANVDDVKESILIGSVLAVVVVFFFLGNLRSTLITGLALPNSLIGAFILMAWAGFTVNIMTLLALSLAVGLLIDDAIVVRENIFRHMEMGKDPVRAAKEGTDEVRLAVIATTMAVIAVFGPVAFLKGVVGQFFREFGLTICFAMLISLFDALTIAPMMSAYFGGSVDHHAKPKNPISKGMNRVLKGFDRFQTWLEDMYEATLRFTVRRPMMVLLLSFIAFAASMSAVKQVTKTFLPAQDAGEFTVSFDLPPGASLEATDQVARKLDEVIRKNPEVELAAQTTGGSLGEANQGSFYVKLVESKKRQMNTSQIKEKLRGQLKDFSFANPKVTDFDAMGAGQRVFNLVIIGNDLAELETFGAKVFEKLRKHPGLTDVDTSIRPGKPELQTVLEKQKITALGVSTKMVGMELRSQIEGVVPAKFRENGYEYDVRVRLREEQRDLKSGFDKTYVPNINNQLIALKDIATPKSTLGSSGIDRQDRGRYVRIMADITPGKGMAEVMADISKMFETDLPLPAGMRYSYVGQAENFKELGESIVVAMGLGVLFIYLVLASLYESFVTPFTIMLALPLALCGSFVALWITHESLNIFSMIGCVMLMGVATKNSILLVDYTNQLIGEGLSRSDAIIKAGRTRLRPILMTTMALIAGTIPIALGLNEASRQRTSMGVAIIGGLISSTLLTLVVVPAAFSYIDRFRIWSTGVFQKLSGSRKSAHPETTPAPANGKDAKSPSPILN